MTPRGSCEDQLSRLFGYEHVVLFGRARAGLVAVVEEIGGHAAPVVIPSNICVAVLAAILAAGAKPVLVPVSPESGLVDDSRFAAAIRGNSSPNGIVMPTHLYGMLGDYRKARRAASEQSWFVLENDSLAATIGLNHRGSADALLLSFGSGKTLDAEGGGAILTNDSRLAAALVRRAEGWPPVRDDDEATETHLILARRHLHALGYAAASESLLDVDVANARSGFNRSSVAKILDALAKFQSENEQRQERLEQWQRALAGLAPALSRPSIAPRSPWRGVFKFQDGLLRDEVVKALRRNGFDAGTNYPPLTDFFPNLLHGQDYADAKQWGCTVLTLWLTQQYDSATIGEAANVIRKIIGAALQCAHEHPSAEGRLPSRLAD